MTTVLVVAAHPDDEVLGCGGTMAKHASQGDAVHVLFLADGVSSRGGPGIEEAKAKRMENAARAAKILGAQAPRGLGLADNRLDGLDLLDVIQPIEAAMAEIGPEIIYTHHGGDLNVDHRVTHQAVLTACRPKPGAAVRAIYAFEVLSSTEWASPSEDEPFRPARFVDVSAHLEQKLGALACYEEEILEFPNSRSVEAVEAQARLRGASAGVTAAEAFEIIRQLG